MKKKINNAKWVIGKKGIKIIMLQVQPGMDDNVYRELNKRLSKLKKNSTIGNHFLYKAFGYYDLILIYETHGLGSELLFEGTINHILDSNEIFCFSWERSTGFSFKIKENNLLAIIFFKIKPEISKQYGINLERTLVEYIFKNGHAKKLTFLGSVGWHEFIVLVHEDHFEGIFNEIQAISQALIRFEKKRRIRIAQKTYTTIGCKYSKSTDNKTLRLAFGKQPFGNSESILLSIICKPQDFYVLSNALKRTFNTDTVYFSIGKTDIRVLLNKNNCKKWSDFIIKLRKFRTDYTGLIISTSTEFAADVMDASSEVQKENKQAITVNLNKVDINNIQKYNFASAEAIVGAIYIFNSLAQNEIIKDSFYDLLSFMMNLRKRSTHTVIKASEKKLERLRYGIDQRSYGTFLSLEGQEGRFFPFKGGIQRVLLSTSVLPKVILERVNVHWPGFVIVGFDHRYMHHEEILNVPLKVIFAPHEWWGLFHETGHVYFNLTDTLNFNDKYIADKIELDIAIPKKEWAQYKDYTKFLSELAVDVFDFQICFLEEWDLYIKSIWGYLVDIVKNTHQSHEQSVQIGNYLLRSFFVYIYYHYEIKRDRNAMKLKYKDIVNLFRNDFLPYLLKNIPDLKTLIKGTRSLTSTEYRFILQMLNGFCQ